MAKQKANGEAAASKQRAIQADMKQKGPGADRSLRDGISPTRYSPSASDDALSQLRMTLAQRSADAQNAARKVKDLRLAASKSNTEAASAARSLQAAESNFAKAEADVKAVDQALEKAAPEKVAELAEAKAQALSRLNAVQAQLDTAKAQAQSKANAAAQAQADVKTADAALSLALDASEEARLNLSPVSVFISRKTMRLYVRKGNLPVYESYVMKMVIASRIAFSGGASRCHVDENTLPSTSASPLRSCGTNHASCTPSTI